MFGFTRGHTELYAVSNQHTGWPRCRHYDINRHSGVSIPPKTLEQVPPSLPSLLSLEVGPLNPASGSGGYCKFTQRGLGQSPSRNRVWCILALKFDIWWREFQWLSWESIDQILCILSSKGNLNWTVFAVSWSQHACCFGLSSKCLQLNLSHQKWCSIWTCSTRTISSVLILVLYYVVLSTT